MRNLRVAFRTDASVQIGTGHVMRCLTLADALRERGVDCLFVCREHPGNLLQLIAQRGHRTVALPLVPSDEAACDDSPAHAQWLGSSQGDDAAATCRALESEAVDWLVVDHYALDNRWESALRRVCRRLMAIDDLADRQHDCDLLLDQNLGRSAVDYNELVPVSAKRLIGPGFALLRPEFARLRSESIARRRPPRLERVLVAMGGVDKDNATGQVLHALAQSTLPEGLQVVVVMGPHAPWLRQVEAQAAQMPCKVQVRVGVDDMGRLMADSDLAIGAAGGTAWERCCLGLPSVVLVVADNQNEGAAALQEAKAAIVIRNASEITQVLADRLSSLSGLLELSESAALVTDGQGATKVAGELLHDCV